MRFFRAFLLTVVPALLAGAGCETDAPSPTLVEDLRVLAVRAEPPELLLDREDTGAPPTVTFQALVVDPRGMPMVYDWRFCPVESSQTCGDFDQRRAQAAPDFQPVLEATHAQTRAGQAQLGGSSLESVGLGDFVVEVPRDLFAYHLAASGWGLGNGAWTSAVLTLGTGGETLQAQKRVVLNARDLSAWNPELAASGWQICPPAPAEPPPGCLPLRPRTPNRNPDIARVEVARSARADAPFEPLAGVVTVAPKETIRLHPTLAEGAAESYQVLDSTLKGNDLVVVERTEEPIVSWFSTAGKFGDAQTAPQLTKTLDNTFTAPEARPPTADGRISLFMVVRDQRGGIGWARVEVEVTP
jgi:hypothetical protein